jgi:hypothetical protein
MLSSPACARAPASPRSDAGAGGGNPSDAKAAAPLGLFCSPGLNPASALVTDFSPASFNGNRGQSGGDPNLTFFTYSYRDPDAPDGNSSDKVENGAFTFAGDVVSPGSAPSYGGGGMHFDSCVNTTTYTGVQYTLTGSSGGCTVYFDLQTYSQQALRERGGCASYCYHFPRKAVVPGATPITVRFSELEGTGIPASAAAMASEIMGMRWQLELAPGEVDAGHNDCSFSLTVDDVKFVK